MKAALASATINVPSVPVVTNVTAQSETAPDNLSSLLVDQITGRVRWTESVSWMSENGVTEMAELGAGKVLSGLVRRINKDITCESIGTPEQIDAFVESLV